MITVLAIDYFRCSMRNIIIKCTRVKKCIGVHISKSTLRNSESVTDFDIHISDIGDRRFSLRRWCRLWYSARRIQTSWPFFCFRLKARVYSKTKRCQHCGEISYQLFNYQILHLHAKQMTLLRVRRKTRALLWRKTYAYVKFSSQLLSQVVTKVPTTSYVNNDAHGRSIQRQTRNTIGFGCSISVVSNVMWSSL
jgi:hypothetical protein